VRPPSARFILELFLIPGVLVALIVVVWLGVNWLFGGGRSAEAFLRDLDSTNPDVRWRAASDLAQTLPRDPRLAADVGFGLQLAARLRQGLEDSEKDERELAGLARLPNVNKDDLESRRSRLHKTRDYIQFLTGCLGHFTAPVGVPLLCDVAAGRTRWQFEPPPIPVLRDLAVRDDGVEPSALALRRRQAVYALAALGQAAKSFDQLRDFEQANLLADLDRKADESSGLEPRLRDWAAAAARCLRGRGDGRPDALGVPAVLEQCATADDPVLREYVAFAANFWRGSEDEDRRLDQALDQLTQDDGRGDELRESAAGAPPADAPRAYEEKGLIVRVNAVLARCRRASPLLAKRHWDLLNEMLNEKELGARMRLVEDGKDKPNQDKVLMTMHETLNALADLHARDPRRDLSPLLPAVERLAKGGNAELAAHAKRTLESLRSNP
jgi:hypothetical protein